MSCQGCLSRVCAALPLAVVFMLAAFTQLPGRESSTVVIQNSPYPEVVDAEAVFGPRVPSGGVTGMLRVASPVTGCEKLTNTGDGPWIALMQRSEPSENCGFVTKARPPRASTPIFFSDAPDEQRQRRRPPPPQSPRV